MVSLLELGCASHNSALTESYSRSGDPVDAVLLKEMSPDRLSTSLLVIGFQTVSLFPVFVLFTN